MSEVATDVETHEIAPEIVPEVAPEIIGPPLPEIEPGVVSDPLLPADPLPAEVPVVETKHSILDSIESYLKEFQGAAEEKDAWIKNRIQRLREVN